MRLRQISAPSHTRGCARRAAVSQQASTVAHSFDSTSPFPRRFDASVPTLLRARSIALTGPLPTSSVLHLAVAHLRGRSVNDDDDDDDDDGHSQESLEARREEQATDDRRHVLVLTSDQAKWRDSLIRENDTSLFSTSTRSVDASFVSCLDRVEIKHLPTSEHLLYFLTTIYSHAEHLKANQAFVETGTRSKNDPSYLPIVPTLVVLHNPSEYLAESQAQSAGLEAYTSLLALASPLLVLVDNDALILEQPLLASHLAQPRRKRKVDEEEGRLGQGDVAEERQHIERMRLLNVLPYFYDWVGIVEPVQQEPDPSQRALTFVMTYTPSLHPSDIPSLLPSTPQTPRQPVAVEFSVQHLSQANGDDEDGLFVQVVS
ncbi:BQ2448_824 [Microbotryum intermedium]|uniref:BQ2448_824 protein n=1 Tax=Microbotryum intermedium TaxID=269621 RepID=A0A238F9L3_9BASI|nr:BQ2448_824 [Microbotryum intermedium]